MKTILLSIALFVTGLLSAQNDPDSIKIKEINMRLKTLEEKVDKSYDNVDSIGYITLYANKINTSRKVNVIVKDSNKNRIELRDSIVGELKIALVNIIISSGTITTIQVLTDKGKVYANGKCFIELSEINIKRCDFLYAGDGTYIKICDFLNYIGSTALPDDDDIVLTKKNEKKRVSKSSGLNNVFSARIYSDLLGLAGDESNGLVQAQVSFKNILHSKNKFNNTRYWFHYVSTNVSISRFDKEFRTIKEVDSSDYLDIYQQSIINAAGKLNIFHGYVRKSMNSVSINVMVGLSAARYQEKDSSKASYLLNMPSFGGEFLFEAKPWKNYGLLAGVTFQQMFFYGIGQIPGLGDPQLIYSPVLEMYWNPNGKESNRLFARFRYVDMTGPSLPFSQFQIGYAVNLSDWVKSK